MDACQELIVKCKVAASPKKSTALIEVEVMEFTEIYIFLTESKLVLWTLI